ncbi:RNA-binding protein cabeza isoform X3 [Drosophila subpulchrella]|uniref:RNA-binding protein cabeza isoform X3 n=1 Tax=Drosophila subpulchrella TaxID=1486046 RepID=UPI0018A17F94|nr:RNA-binding protein cabeza isoform X3 [Drosophila subpulchrella]
MERGGYGGGAGQGYNNFAVPPPNYQQMPNKTGNYNEPPPNYGKQGGGGYDSGHRGSGGGGSGGGGGGGGGGGSWNDRGGNSYGTRRILGWRWRRRRRWLQQRRHDHPGGHHLCLRHGSIYHRAGY